jgi:hypothetical protein
MMRYHQSHFTTIDSSRLTEISAWQYKQRNEFRKVKKEENRIRSFLQQNNNTNIL